jgi:phosphoglucosamine mutase
VLFHDIPAGDGLIAGLRALSIGLRSGALSDATGGFTRLPRRQGKLRVRERPPLGEIDGLADLLAVVEPTLGVGGRVFLRYSGTEPVLRILVEGRSKADVDDTFQAVEALLRRVLG